MYDWYWYTVSLPMYTYHISLTAAPVVTSHDDKSLHPLKDTYQSTPAGLVFIALFTEMLATTLDQPLPHPLTQRTAIGCV